MEKSLQELLAACKKVLSASPAFILLNVYATVLTRVRIEKEAEELRSSLKAMLGESPATITAGELALEDAAGVKLADTQAAVQVCLPHGPRQGEY